MSHPEIQLNLKIPGYKNKIDLEILSLRVKNFKRPIKIVDIGSSTGIATWHFAKNAPTGSTVYAIDPWKGEDFNVGRNSFCNNWQEGMLNTFELFQKHVIDCANIIPIKGRSPECWLGELVDFVFIDLDMGPEDTQRAMEKNLAFWQKFLKPGGQLAGYHYAPRTHEGFAQTKMWYRIPIQEHAKKHGYQIENPDYSWLWFLNKGVNGRLEVEAKV